MTNKQLQCTDRFFEIMRRHNLSLLSEEEQEDVECADVERAENELHVAIRELLDNPDAMRELQQFYADHPDELIRRGFY